MITEAMTAEPTTAIAVSETIMVPQLGAQPVQNAPAEPTVDAPNIDKAAVEAEFTRLRELHSDHISKNSSDQKSLDATVQERLRSFLAAGYPQAIELYRERNRAILIELIDGFGLEPGNSMNKLMEQIAFMQLARQDKDGRWTVPARRHQRIGMLYRIFHDQRWHPGTIEETIIKQGGTSKILAAHKNSRRDPQTNDVAERRATAVRAHTKSVPVAKMPDVTPENSGEWRLALVSVHDGEVCVRKLVGKLDDAATARERDAFCKEEFVMLNAIALLNGDPIA